MLLANLASLPPAVGEGVRAERVPFGRLLMDHVRDRCVLLRSCWRVRHHPHFGLDWHDYLPATVFPHGHAAAAESTHAASTLAAAAAADAVGADLAAARDAQGGFTYARTVVIQCDGQPAAEVLEIVVA